MSCTSAPNLIRNIKEFDYYAFPRTGSHFLMINLGGLFDLEVVRQGTLAQDNKRHLSKEERSRTRELRPFVLLLLKQRWPSWEKSPVRIYANPSGVYHSTIKARDLPILVMIRNPIATMYSLYNLFVSRFKYKVGDIRNFVEKNLDAYRKYYQPAFELQKEGHPLLMIRYEELLTSPAPMEKICKFLCVTPKLNPSIVFFMTRFKVITKIKYRTFYRHGNNQAWKRDLMFLEAVKPFLAMEWEEYGYESAGSGLDLERKY